METVRREATYKLRLWRRVNAAFGLRYVTSPPTKWVLYPEREKRANMPTFCPFGMGLGTHHPQYFGLACHLGVLCDIPTIGIGKTFLSVDGL